MKHTGITSIGESLHMRKQMIQIPVGLAMSIADLLGDIAKMKPGFEIYETAKKLTKDFHDCVAGQLK